MKGDLFIVEYNTPHAFVENRDCPQRFEAYDLMFTPDFIDTSLLGYRTFQHLACSSLFYSLVPEERDFGPDLHLYDAGFQDFGELFGRIFRSIGKRKRDTVKLSAPMSQSCWSRRCGGLWMSGEEKREKGSALSVRQTQYLEMAVDYLRAHYNTPVRRKSWL